MYNKGEVWFVGFPLEERPNEILNRPVVDKKRFIFDKIIYKDKYEFKSIAALSRFIGISETQVRRYLETPEKYNIKLINNCND